MALALQDAGYEDPLVYPGHLNLSSDNGGRVRLANSATLRDFQIVGMFEGPAEQSPFILVLDPDREFAHDEDEEDPLPCT